jgi:5'-deoxynucleotidase YfbR-like HD superfamily hydrolase
MTLTTHSVCIAPEASLSEIEADIATIVWSLKLHGIRRYFHHRFWEEESRAAEFADRIEPELKLESVSAHSWHVADCILLLADHFPYLDRGHCIELAILHDKLEILTGDKSPIGRDGSGNKAHAFCVEAQQSKERDEWDALDQYLSKIRQGARLTQRVLLSELIDGHSLNARFVKAVDKLQAFAYVHSKKDGDMSNRHIVTTLRYTAKTTSLFPGLQQHYDCMRLKFLKRIALRRKITLKRLEDELFGEPEFNFNGFQRAP